MPDSLKNETPSMASVMQQAVLNKLKELHTAMPGIIVSFNATLQTAEVQPAIRRVFKITNTENKEILTPRDLPKLINVPVIFPRGGGFSLTFPVVAGDECLIQFCERDIDNWHVNGGVQNANSFRQHSLSDAICFVGISSQPNKISSFDTDNVVLRDEAGTTKISITPDDKIIMDAVTQIEVTAPSSVWVGDINLTGKLTHAGDVLHTGNVTQTGVLNRTGASIFNGAASVIGAPLSVSGGGSIEVTGGDIEADGVTLKTHVHPVTQPNGTPTGTPV